jgi:ABC-2 type transport system permease protein
MTSRSNDSTTRASTQWRPAIGAGMRAEWQHLSSNRSLLALLLFLPLLYATTVAYLYRSESVVDAPVIVVDQDGTKASSRLTWLIDATEEARVVDRMQSVDEAFARMRQHETSAVVLLPQGFEKRLLSTEPATVKLWIDSANMLTYGTAYAGIRAAVSVLDNETTEKAFIARGSTRRQAERRTSPIELNERLLFHPTASYGAFMSPAVFVIALQQAILLGFALSVGTRRDNTGCRDADEPKAYSKLIGRFLVHLPFHLLSAAVLAWLVQYLYQFPAANAFGSFVLLAVLTLATGPLAILVSLPFTNGQTPMQVLMLISTPLFLASGYTWPLAQMPEAVQLVAKLVPSTPALSGLRVVAITSGNLSLIQESLTRLAIQGVFYVALGFVAVTCLGHWRRRIRSAGHVEAASTAA